METELLPCPFCGGEAEVIRHLSGWYPTAKHRGGCPMLRVNPPDDEYYITKSYAAEAWNRRANDVGERPYYEADLRRAMSDMMERREKRDRRANDAD